MNETRFAAAEIACGLLRTERDKLQKQANLLTLGLLQEKTKVTQLNKALHEYGQHKKDCAFIEGLKENSFEKCTCGFNETLKGPV